MTNKQKTFFSTKKGEAHLSSIEKFLDSTKCKQLQNKVNLIFTSPPFPLVSPKAYGNLQGTEYLEWISKLAPRLANLLTDDGSMVIEIGNSWNKGEPTMSTLPLRTLMAVAESANLHICQQMVWHNPGKLPGPATWVNVKRERITDSFTHVWWFSRNLHPYADNRQVLTPYTSAMRNLIKKKSYNHGKRPSGHTISEQGFLSNNGGSIPRSTLIYANTGFDSAYRDWCKSHGITQHPARMPIALAEFFIKFLTRKNGLVLDPFAGSCTTGKAAENLSRRWICIEQSKDYLQGAKGRFL